MDDYRAFLVEIADDLRGRESRTVVARRAYDGISARLQALADSAPPGVAEAGGGWPKGIALRS